MSPRPYCHRATGSLRNGAWFALALAALACDQQVLEAVVAVPHDAATHATDVVGNSEDADVAADSAANDALWGPEAAGPDVGMMDLRSNRDQNTEPDAPARDPSLIAHFAFEEGNANFVGDSSGHRNDGLLSAPDTAFAWGPGKKGSAINLATGIFITIPSSPAIDSPATTGALTLAAWVFPRSFTPANFNFFVSRQIGSTPFDNFGLGLRDGRPTFALFSDFPAAPTAVTLRRWVHIAATFDGRQARVFVDGQQVTRVALDRTISSQSRPLLIGGNQNDGSGRPKEFFDGFVDELRIWNRALSTQEIAAEAR